MRQPTKTKDLDKFRRDAEQIYQQKDQHLYTGLPDVNTLSLGRPFVYTQGGNWYIGTRTGKNVIHSVQMTEV